MKEGSFYHDRNSCYFVPDQNGCAFILSYEKRILVYFIGYYEIKIVTISCCSNEKFIDYLDICYCSFQATLRAQF